MPWAVPMFCSQSYCVAWDNRYCWKYAYFLNEGVRKNLPSCSRMEMKTVDHVGFLSKYVGTSWSFKKIIRKISITSQIRLKWRLVNGSMPEHSGKHSCHSGNPSNTLYYIKKEIRFYPHPKISLYILKILSPSHYFSMYRNRAPHRHILK